MIRTLSGRLLYAFIVLWLISLLAFWMSKMVPGDEIRDYLTIDERGYSATLSPSADRIAYLRVANKRGFDIPAFYFTIAPSFYPDSMYGVLPVEDRAALKNWIIQSRQGDQSLQLHHYLRAQLNKKCTAQLNAMCKFYDRLLVTEDLETIRQQSLIFRDSLASDPSFKKELDEIEEVITHSNALLTRNKAGSFTVLPSFQWHGTHNQYHRWITGLLLQKPLTSLVDGRDAWTKISEAFKWTILMNGLAFLLAITFGVLIGIWSAVHEGTHKEKYVQWILFALFAIPSFWLATLFIYFLSSGEWLRIFPAGGLGAYHQTTNPGEALSIITYHLFLPVTCLALGSLAYISRQMKQSILHEMTQPYVLSLRIQGVSEKTILRKHVIRNALFPIITIIGGSVPGLLSGSLIIEIIFSIPGMGRLMFNSLMSRDWPVAFPILMLVAAVTVVTYILTDVLYKWIDPRVKTVAA